MKLTLSAFVTAVLAVILAVPLTQYAKLFLPIMPEAFIMTALCLWAVAFIGVRWAIGARAEQIFYAGDIDEAVEAQRCCREYWWTRLWAGSAAEEGQDIAEYAVMLAVILIVVIGTINIIGKRSNNVFSQVGSALDSAGSSGGDGH